MIHNDPRFQHLFRAVRRDAAAKPTWVQKAGAVIVAIVAVGIVVAGLLDDPQPDAVAIPGCGEVIQPADMQRINYAIVDDNSAPREFDAATMSDVLIQALPAGTTVKPDPTFPPLTFDVAATAHGTISLGGASGDLTVMLSTSDQPVGPCFAGYVDERRTLDDGTTIDTTSSETSSRVRVYAPDGSRVDASADSVLTVQQLTDIAMTPGLRTGQGN